MNSLFQYKKNFLLCIALLYVAFHFPSWCAESQEKDDDIEKLVHNIKQTLNSSLSSKPGQRALLTGKEADNLLEFNDVDLSSSSPEKTDPMLISDTTLPRGDTNCFREDDQPNIIPPKEENHNTIIEIETSAHPIPQGVFGEDDNRYITSLITYHLSENSQDFLYKTDSAEFMASIDKGIFCPDHYISIKTRFIQLMGGLVGLLPSSALTGFTLSNMPPSIIPPGHPLSIALQCCMMFIATPIYFTQFNRIGFEAGNFLFDWRPFTPSTKKDDLLPHTYALTTAHKWANAGMVIPALMRGTYYALALYLAEKKFPDFYYVMVVPFALSFFEQMLSKGLTGINRWYNNYVYDDRLTRQKRKRLFELNDEFLKAININPEFAQNIYNIIHRQKILIDNEIKKNTGNFYFLGSALFFKSPKEASADCNPFIHTTENNILEDVSDEEESLPDIKKNSVENDEYLSFQSRIKDLLEKVGELKSNNAILTKENHALNIYNKKALGVMAADQKPSPGEKFLSYLTTLLAGKAWIARGASVGYVLGTVFIELFKIDPQIAIPVVTALVGTDIFLRDVIDYYTQETSLKNFLALRKFCELSPLKKLGGGLGIIFGFLGGSISTINAMDFFNIWSLPLPLQIAFAIPNLIMDFNDFKAFYEKFFYKCQLDITTLRSGSHISLLEKKAWLEKWSLKAQEDLNRLDGKTIGRFYEKVTLGNI